MITEGFSKNLNMSRIFTICDTITFQFWHIITLQINMRKCYSLEKLIANPIIFILQIEKNIQQFLSISKKIYLFPVPK